MRVSRIAKKATRNIEVAALSRTGVGDTMNMQIRNAVDAGEGDLRIRSLRQRLSTSPDDLMPRMELARYYKELGFGEVALEHYRMASIRFPENAVVAVLIARALSDLAMPAEARAHLQQFVSAHPESSSDAWSWLGIMQDEAGDLKAAEISHRSSIRLKPGSDAAFNNRGYNLLLQGRNEEAAAEFRKALAIAPGSVLARNNLFTALPGQTVDAMADPATAHSNLAAILIDQGEYNKARHELELALRYKKDHAAALSNLSLMAELEGGSVQLSRYAQHSAWQKFIRTVGDVLFGSVPEPRPKQSADLNGRIVHPAPAGAGSN
ncbi:MAG: tetratricopeptide repeat protein [Bryobacteraceae bacterium]|nr:tetratricopeptide repeat protein [Bryobacteraceae bacterium]